MSSLRNTRRARGECRSWALTTDRGGKTSGYVMLAFFGTPNCHSLKIDNTCSFRSAVLCIDRQIWLSAGFHSLFCGADSPWFEKREKSRKTRCIAAPCPISRCITTTSCTMWSSATLSQPVTEMRSRFTMKTSNLCLRATVVDFRGTANWSCTLSTTLRIYKCYANVNWPFWQWYVPFADHFKK